MPKRDPVEFERQREGAFAVRGASDEEFLDGILSMLRVPGTLARFESDVVERTMWRLAVLAAWQAAALRAAPAEAIEKQTRPTTATRCGLGCGSCGWCVDRCCTVDPPMIWRGENMYRFVRPEVGDDTPACSRWEVKSC